MCATQTPKYFQCAKCGDNYSSFSLNLNPGYCPRCGTIEPEHEAWLAKNGKEVSEVEIGWTESIKNSWHAVLGTYRPKTMFRVGTMIQVIKVTQEQPRNIRVGSLAFLSGLRKLPSGQYIACVQFVNEEEGKLESSTTRIPLDQFCTIAAFDNVEERAELAKAINNAGLATKLGSLWRAITG